MNKRTQLGMMIFIFVIVLLWSGIKPYDQFTWILEVAPAVIALGLLIATYRRFEFTLMVYYFILIHAIILMVGGKYTYAEVPLFNFIRDHFGLARNSYDGVGHFAQGFVPAIVVREILLRKTPLRPGAWLFFIVLCITLAFSAFYELIEWWVSLITGSAGDSFLGTQGDVWDTQKDMALCLLGSFLALSCFSRPHDRAMAKLPGIKVFSSP